MDGYLLLKRDLTLNWYILSKLVSSFSPTMGTMNLAKASKRN
jgi:hypothetical protein